MIKEVEKHIQEYKSLKLHEVVDYNKFNELSITAHSTQIEGSTLSIRETGLLINDGITPKGKPLEHSLMVRDHHEALKTVLLLGTEKKSIDIKSICELNGMVMKSTGQQYNTALGNIDATKGELRKGAVFVGNRYFPAHNKVPSLLDSLCTKLNEKLRSKLSVREQVDLSYNAHFNLVNIHPHYDGNGRTSRLLMNQIQSRFNLPISSVYKEDKNEYFEAIEKSYKEKSLKSFNKFMDSQYIKHLSNDIEMYKSQNQNNNKEMDFLL